MLNQSERTSMFIILSIASACFGAGAACADVLPPYPHLDAKDELAIRARIEDFARVRNDLTAAAVDAAALLALVEGDVMPHDLAGLLGEGQRVWRTRPGGDGGVFIHFRHPKNPGAMSDVLVRGERVTAVVRDGEGNAESVRTLDDGRMIRQFLADIDRGECGGCAPTNGEGPLKGMDSGAGGDGGLAGTCNDGNTVDVFTLVHIDAVVEMGGLVAALDEVLLAMEVSNEAYINSGITLRARTVGIRIVADALFQGDNFGTDLARLRNATDGTFDIGTDSRAEWGADLIKLMRIDDPVDGAGGVVGLAYTLTSSATTPSNAGFSVDSWEYSISNLTFPHEMGHNMGCCHAPGDGGGCNSTSDSYYTYSRGHRFTGDSGSNYRSVMAYNPGTRIPYFSSPLVQFDGVDTGTADRDNARSIRNTRTTFCDFVCSTVPGNDECISATTIADGGFLTVTNDHATNYGTSGYDVAGSDYNDVWAKFVAPANGRVLLRLCPTSATTETTLAVYEDSCAGTRIATDAGTYGFEFCNSQFASAVQFSVYSGETYYIRCSCTGNTVFTGTLRYDFTSNGLCGIGTGSCYEVHAVRGCNNFDCCGTVCGIDPFCCETTWDQTCVNEANDFCAQCGDTDATCYAPHTGHGCSDTDCCALVTAVDATCGHFEWDAACAELAMTLCAGCGLPTAGDCRAVHATPGCAIEECCTSVCAADVYCCETEWDIFCVNRALDVCGLPGDLNGDGHVNASDLSTLLGAWGTAGGDVNGDGATDAADMAALLNAWTG
jgi:hypothetical protein